MLSTVSSVQDLSIPGITDLVEAGRGRTAVVYRGMLTQGRRTVAVKVLDTPLTDPNLRSRFERECRVLATLTREPHVAAVHDAGLTADARPYVVTDVLARSLRDLLDERGTLRWQEAVALGAEVASGLHAAHRAGLLHRDVSPSTIRIASGDLPKLTDFGLARYASPSAGGAAASPRDFAYAAPELVAGKPVDERSDVYSLAAVLHESMSGRTPFVREGDGDIPAVLERIVTEPPWPLAPSGVPAEVEAVVLAGLSKDPGRRPVTAEVFAQQLLAAAKAAGEATGALARPTAAVIAAAETAGAAGAAAGVASGAATSGALGGAGGSHGARRTPTGARPPGAGRRWPALVAFGVLAALVIAGLAWVVGRGGDDTASDTTAAAVATAPETTAAPSTTVTPTSPPTTRAAATTPTTPPTTAPTEGPFRIVGFTSETGSATFTIPADGKRHSFTYEVQVAGYTEDTYCPVRSGPRHVEGPGLASIDLGGCFPATEAEPVQLTVQAFGAGTTTFTLYVCDGERLDAVCPQGTRTEEGQEITIIATEA